MITYEIILEYLAPPINTFSTKQNIMMPFADFTYFKDIFDDTFYRYGILNCDKSDKSHTFNLSLYNSILYCLNITTLDKSLLANNDLWKLSNTIHINVIVFDFKNNKLSASYYGDYFNPWRPTIYLANYNDFWEPIISNDTRIFSLSSYKGLILKNKILANEINRYREAILITINDNFTEIIELEQFSDTNEVLFINNTTFSKNKLEKMKKEELIQIISNMNKKIDISKPTKKDLIEIICKE
jgi:hypothetical protein